MSCLRRAFADLVVEVRAWSEDPSRPEVRFISSAFRGLYPRQRYHRVIHALPPGYHERHLADAIWYELAPRGDRDRVPRARRRR